MARQKFGVAGIYNATPLSLSDEEAAALALDSAGRVIMGLGGSSSYSVDDTAMPATPAILPVGGEYRASATTYTDGDATVLQTDVNGNLKITNATLQAGEDLTNDVQKVEHRYSYTRLAADGQIKAGAGFIHTLTFACADAAPTAGSIIVYDSLTETGTVIYSETFDTTAFRGYSVLLDVSFATGCYVGFTTTADVGCTVSFR